MIHRRRIVAVLGLVVLVVLAVAAPAQASELVDRKTKKEDLAVDAKGNALVTFKTGAKMNHILYWGAMDADLATKSNLRFPGHDRSGGWKSKRADYKHFKNVCGPYTGPALPYVVKACTAPDGTHWVLQKWARMTDNYGGKVDGFWKELRLSHFSKPPAELNVWPNWSWSGRYMHIVATFTYDGKPWYALNFKDNGYVTDQIGRNVTIDSYNSDMGAGWHRVNAVLTHRPSGQLCFGFTPKDNGHGGLSGSGYSKDNLYRLAVPGPGVSPDVEKVFNGVTLDQYTPEADQVTNDFIRSLIGNYTGPQSCKSIN